MIEPNFDLLLWVLLASFFIGAISNIIAGAMKIERSTHYDTGNIIVGIIELFILAWVVMK